MTASSPTHLVQKHIRADQSNAAAQSLGPQLDLSAEERSVIDAIRRTAYGAIEVVLHQQRIVQVVRSEKTRFE